MSVRMDIIPSSAEQIYSLHDVSCKHGKNIEIINSLYLCPKIQYKTHLVTWSSNRNNYVVFVLIC